MTEQNKKKNTVELTYREYANMRADCYIKGLDDAINVLSQTRAQMDKGKMSDDIVETLIRNDLSKTMLKKAEENPPEPVKEEQTEEDENDGTVDGGTYNGTESKQASTDSEKSKSENGKSNPSVEQSKEVRSKPSVSGSMGRSRRRR